LVPQPQVGSIYRLPYWPFFQKRKERWILLVCELPKIYEFRAAIFTSDRNNQLTADQFVAFNGNDYFSAFVQPKSKGILIRNCKLALWDYVKQRSGCYTITINPVGSIVTCIGNSIPIDQDCQLTTGDWSKFTTQVPAAFKHELTP